MVHGNTKSIRAVPPNNNEENQDKINNQQSESGILHLDEDAHIHITNPAYSVVKLT